MVEEAAGPRIVAPAFSIRSRRNAIGPIVYARLHDLARGPTSFGPIVWLLCLYVLCDTVIRFGWQTLRVWSCEPALPM